MARISSDINTKASRHDIDNFRYEPTEVGKSFSINNMFIDTYGYWEEIYYKENDERYNKEISDHIRKKYKKYISLEKENPGEMTTDIIKNCLLGIKQMDFFSCGGCINGATSPSLYIDDIGYIGFPFGKEQAQRVISKCKLAPLGRKEEIFDTDIRHTWQLEPSQFTIQNPRWDSMIESLVEHVRDKLVCDYKNVKHRLYKLLIYEPGSFFKPHCDNEKEHGIFGTLVVELPSCYSGGKLIVRHNNKVSEYDFGDTSNAPETNFIAFYADCEYEIKPVLTGYRICLVYNLVNTSSGIVPAIKDDTDTLKELINGVNNWINNPSDCPGLLAYGCEHRYTDEGLSFSRLKGRDIVIAQMLMAVSESVPLDLYLVNMERTVKYHMYGLEMTTLTAWFSPTGKNEPNEPKLELIPIHQEDMVQEEFWKDKKYKKEHAIDQDFDLYEYYHHTGIIFWPSQIKHYKYVGKRIYEAVMYIKTLEEECDIREVASIIISRLKIFRDFEPTYRGNFLYDFYKILFRYNLTEQLTEFTNFVEDIKLQIDINKMYIDAVKQLYISYPTLSTNQTFRTMVSSAIRTLKIKIDRIDANVPKGSRDFLQSWENKRNEKRKTLAEFEIIINAKLVTGQQVKKDKGKKRGREDEETELLTAYPQTMSIADD